MAIGSEGGTRRAIDPGKNRLLQTHTMNLPNKLTVGRLLLTGAFLPVFFCGLPYHNSLALALFAAASITDHFDGKIARSRNLITNFGILMDPLADKILVCSVFIAFVGRGLVPAWMVIIIVARELAITGLRLLAAARNVVLAAESCGKNKTTSQMVTLVALLVTVSYPEWGGWAVQVFGYAIQGHPWTTWVAEISLWVAVVFTAYSGTAYLWRNRSLYLEDM